MNNKNIIIAGAISVGLYLFSQTKQMKKVAQRTRSTATPTIRKRTAQIIGKKIGKTVAQKVAPVNIYEYVRERARMNKAIPIRSKKIARKIPSVGTSAARRRMAQKIEETRNRKIREQRAAAARKAAASHIYSGTKTTHNPYRSSFPATGPKNIVHTTSTRQRTAQKIAKKVVAPWKAPLVWSPKPNFRVITPSDILRNLAKKDIARKKAIEQKKVQKTTHSTPSARRKKRLEALYGSHWHDIWVERQKR